jgi:DNA-binding LacI/PurR family transcriptional regulator
VETRPGTERRTTLADVAASAGVSRATASRALADDARISEPTRRAVREAASALGYVPNAAARSLRARRTRAFGLLLPDLGDPVHGQVAAGFELEAAENGYSVIIVAAHDRPDEERRALTVFMERTTDGICLASTVLEHEEAQSRAGAVPVVTVQPDHERGVGDPGRLAPGSIQTDDAAGMAQATRHLLATGRTDITYLGTGTRATNRMRQAAVERVVEEATGRLPRIITMPDQAWMDPEAVGTALGPRLPEAVACYDDKLALALLDGLRRRGLSAPRDVAVTGFDGIPFASLSNPRLTTVATPVVEMGRMAARSLVQAIATGVVPAPIVVPVELVVRESSGAAGRSDGAMGRRVAAGRGSAGGSAP